MLTWKLLDNMDINIDCGAGSKILHSLSAKIVILLLIFVITIYEFNKIKSILT